MNRAVRASTAESNSVEQGGRLGIEPATSSTQAQDRDNLSHDARCVGAGEDDLWKVVAILR
jgi:hypothetical protein